jgi:hypothetical protein
MMVGVALFPETPENNDAQPLRISSRQASIHMKERLEDGKAGSHPQGDGSTIRHGL